VQAKGNFEVVELNRSLRSKLALNGSERGGRATTIIVLISDGTGIAHRTAARIMLQGVKQGKANGLLAMETLPFSGLVMTYSLNTSGPGASQFIGVMDNTDVFFKIMRATLSGSAQ
jgi:alkaline phosphatase